MEMMRKAVQALFITLCLTLMVIGAVWNMAQYGVQNSSQALDKVEEAVPVSGNIIAGEPLKQEEEAKLFSRQQLAELRLQRDRSWAQRIEQLENMGQQEAVLQCNLQRFQEQQMELLIAAKGFDSSLVVITQRKVNVMVDAQEAASGYQRLHELVTGNLEVEQAQVVIIPVGQQ